MKKKILLIIFVIFIIIAISAALLLLVPKRFGKGIDPEDISKITVFDGSTGVSFDIENPDDIKEIVENIQNTPTRRSGISLSKVGYTFSIEYIDRSGKPTQKFILNSPRTIRKDPFFYTSEEDFCWEKLRELESGISG